MGDTVKAINILSAADNAAAVNERIAQIIAAIYSGPDWKRMGPNFMQNVSSGEVVNLNQEAVKELQAEGPRADAVATVSDAAGVHRSIFIPQDAVQAAGGNLSTVAAKLQAVLNEAAAPLDKVPLWVYGVGLAGVAYLVFRRKKPASRARYGGRR